MQRFLSGISGSDTDKNIEISLECFCLLCWLRPQYCACHLFGTVLPSLSVFNCV